VLPVITFQYKNGGQDEYSAQAYAVRDGNLLVFTATASDEASIENMFTGTTLS